jgi:hypothetical protein
LKDTGLDMVGVKLKAANPDFPDYDADEGMRTLARLRAVLEPGEIRFEEH